MNNESDIKVELGSTIAPPQFYIKIMEDGPYMVYGNPPIDQQLIVPNEEGSSWIYRKGMVQINTDHESPLMLCRCGASRCKPECDGSHRHHHWNSEETAPHDGMLEDSEILAGERIFLTDNQAYCAFARFCDAEGRIWNIVQEAITDDDVELAKREAAHCPAGRLLVWNAETNRPYEHKYIPSLSILEDCGIKVSGPIWVKGGMRIEGSDGRSYEVRNRVTLCRCGESMNKPFCDGTHASMKFDDGLPVEPIVPHEDF